MIMDEPSSCPSNPVWYSSPRGFQMSWDQSSYMDERESRFSNSNTPQRGPPAINNNADEEVASTVPAPSPYHQGNFPYGGFPMEPHLSDSFYPFPEIGVFPSYIHHSPGHHHVTLPPRQNYEHEQEPDPDVSPPPKLKRTTTENFELSLSHSTSSPESGSSVSSTTVRVKRTYESSPEQEAVPEHRDASEQKSAERVHATMVPHPSEYPYAAHNYASHPANSAFAASRMYDNAFPSPNTGEGAPLPVNNLPVQSARKPPAAAKKPTKAKAKRPSRHSTKKVAAAAGVAVPAAARKAQKLKFLPTEAELIEACTPRAQKALRIWYQRLTELHEYKMKHGNCSVPQKYPKNPPLGTWVNKQRMEYKNRNEGGRHSLTDTKLRRLEELGFDWGKRKGDASWETKFQELVEFKNRVGTCHVPTKYETNPALGRWVSTQRSQYKLFVDGHKSTMTQARIDRLNSIGFVWNMIPMPRGQS